MNQKERINLAQWVANLALKKGATEAATAITRSRSVQVDIREQRLDIIRESTDNSLSLQIFRDNKFSTHSTNNLNRVQLEKFIGNAVDATAYLAPDPDRKLPDPSLYPTNLEIDLNLVDHGHGAVTPQFRIEKAMETEQLVRQLNGAAQLLSASSGFSDNELQGVRFHTNGFTGSWESTSYGLSASLSVLDGTARPAGSGFARTRFLDKLPSPETIASDAVSDTLRQLGQKPIQSGKYTMILENRVAGNILGRIFGPMSARNVYQRNSFLIDKINTQIGSPLLTIIDDPMIPGGLGSRLFDGEGIKAVRRELVKNGVLNSYLVDYYFGRKLGITPNGGSTSNILMELGSRNLQEIIAAQEKAILITSFSGGNASVTTGDFSFGFSGQYIENGKIVQPVNEMNISGNLLNLWQQLVETGNDPFLFSPSRIPTLVFNDVIFSGL
ncbi:MAG TPA: TldD/PmbA family protein [Bacteroidales bacterium]|nr:TldD/PmbA family protein [Bacteroidales bacterium]